MPPRKRTGKWANTRYERPLDDKPIMPGVLTPAESYWQGKVVGHCTAKSVLCYHTHDSRRSEAGFPDCTMLGPRGLMFRELKVSEHGVVTDEQAKWIDALCAAGYDADVWWFPRDWTSGRVHKEINNLARRGPAPVDLVGETAKALYLSTVSPHEVPGAGLLWDAGARVNRAWWRKEAQLALAGAAELALPVGEEQTRQWLREHALSPSASPAEVLSAVRKIFTRHIKENGDQP